MKAHPQGRGERRNALWGRGGKGERARHWRGGVVLIALLAAFVIPAAAVASTAGGPKQLPWKSTATYPAGSLLAQAQADPTASFPVIVQVQDRHFQNLIGKFAGQNGKLKHQFKVIDGLSMTLPGWAILNLAENPKLFGKVHVTQDKVLRTVGAPDLGSELNWQGAIAASQLWSHSATECGVDPLTGLRISPFCDALAAYDAPQAPAIAVVDTGIDATKAADFGGRVVAAVNYSTLSPTGATGDQMGHGTMVAGIAAGASSYAPGVAPSAPLVDVRTGNAQGQSLSSDVIASIDWIVANKAAYNIRVVNLSLVGSTASSVRYDPLDKAVEKLWLNGIVVVAAAGNNGYDDGTASGIGAPANDPFIITVGAADQGGTADPADDFRAPWSAYGHTADGFAKPELSAPGRYIVAPVPEDSTLAKAAADRVVAPGYMWMSGTSLAAPQVAGAAAQILAVHPNWTPDQVKGALMVTASPTAAPGIQTGVGEVNALAATYAVANPPNPNLHLNDFLATDSSTGEVTFDADSWAQYVQTNTDWAATDWAATDWAATDWAATDWAATDWAATDWAATDWAATDWAATDWAATDWAATDWAATDWAATDWAATEASSQAAMRP